MLSRRSRRSDEKSIQNSLVARPAELVELPGDRAEHLARFAHLAPQLRHLRLQRVAPATPATAALRVVVALVVAAEQRLTALEAAAVGRGQKRDLQNENARVAKSEVADARVVGARVAAGSGSYGLRMVSGRVS